METETQVQYQRQLQDTLQHTMGEVKGMEQAKDFLTSTATTQADYAKIGRLSDWIKRTIKLQHDVEQELSELELSELELKQACVVKALAELTLKNST
jgi:hypothetical protein